MGKEDKLAANEGIKERSRFLRGTIADGLADVATGGMSADDQQLLKFHGTYQQDDRDLRAERRKHKLEKAFSFMIRIRVPGGVATAKQWLEMDRMASQFGNETFKLTTRQAFQLHGVIKTNLKRTIREINEAAMDSIAACGDVNRNVMCNPNPEASAIHPEVQAVAQAISDHLTPRTRAYHEIWLDGEKVVSSEEEEEPIYGKTYLPRKFKITIAVPPSNDVDVHANDLSFVAIANGRGLEGFNVLVGGGMGMTHGQEDTYPRTADVIGFVPVGKVVDVAEKVVIVQKEFGDRRKRKHARLKYTIDDHGVDWFRNEVESRLGYKLDPPREYVFTGNGDRFGWSDNDDGTGNYTLFVQGGRVLDNGHHTLRSALRTVAEEIGCEFRLTPNQNVTLAKVAAGDRARLEELLAAAGHSRPEDLSALRLHSIACVALPTCGLALAEAERFLPDVLTNLEEVMEEAGLRHDAITIRMTGCPNGCARPYLAEIAFVGRGPGKYNLYLGGSFAGDRLNKLYRASVQSAEITEVLAPVIRDYAQNRTEGERFGDFVIRQGYVKETTEGRDFHAGVDLPAPAGSGA
ncbi:MAG: NADPH-dependent assimilatory sulfite reductase hemoprotein subunit [Akkermansiaceae bacterium]|nr:NADPH-dependent assimilatory sulfite reductase hemoprotein subunit [Akkermansiaceae bacterium]NNM28678.1 NADPH-dependent assimilatory sulfite reductase hemoprotein subunit [Akkermansiaceae bacterium]